MNEREGLQIMVESEFGEFKPVIEDKDDQIEITFTGEERTMIYQFNLNTMIRFCKDEGMNFYERMLESILFNMKKTRFK